MSSVGHLDLHLVINSRGLSGYQNRLEITLIRKVGTTGKLFLFYLLHIYFGYIKVKVMNCILFESDCPVSRLVTNPRHYYVMTGL